MYNNDRKFQNECHTNKIFCYQLNEQKIQIACVQFSVKTSFDVYLAVAKVYIILIKGYFVYIREANIYAAKI